MRWMRPAPASRARCAGARNSRLAMERLSGHGGCGSPPTALPRLRRAGEKIEQLPSKAPFSKRFEEIVGQACESAAVSQVARRFQLPESTVRAIDVRYLERWNRHRRQPALKQMGVVMKAAQAKLAGKRVDGKALSERVRAKLS